VGDGPGRYYLSRACFRRAERQRQTDCANDDFCGQQLA
jgi:hypothetical protein